MKDQLHFEPVKKIKFGESTLPLNKRERTNRLMEKMCDKLVRLEIVDGRQYIGIFVSCDKSGCLFIVEVLELVDVSS